MSKAKSSPKQTDVSKPKRTMVDVKDQTAKKPKITVKATYEDPIHEDQVVPAVGQKRLSLKQEKFCELYASDREFFGNGTQSYIEAYDLDLSKPNAYNVARAAAARLLANVSILRRIDELLELDQFNDAHVDKQLAYWATQKASPQAAVAAIREYNALKARITRKIDHTTGGKPIPLLGGLSVRGHDGSQEDSSASEEN